MTQVPRNPRPIQSWDGVKTCNLESERRRNPQRLAHGPPAKCTAGPGPDPTCGREAPNQWPG